jgi:hypothetical protein
MRVGADEILENGLQFEEGDGGRKVEVVVSPATAELEGAVINNGGAVIGARVRVAPDPETLYNRFRSRNARADQTGHFLITGLAPGKYRVIAKDPASESSAFKSEPQIVSLSEHDQRQYS